MKPLSSDDVSTIKMSDNDENNNQNDVKSVSICRFCGESCFIKKKMPYWRGTPPQKVGVVCLKCGETTVVSYQEFCQHHWLKAK